MNSLATASPSLALSRLGFSPGHFKDFLQLEHLGKGGFGSVWKCRNKFDQNEYAVKMIKLPKQMICKEKILREPVTMQTLNRHRNIVKFYNSWIEQIPHKLNEFITEEGCSIDSDSLFSQDQSQPQSCSARKEFEKQNGIHALEGIGTCNKKIIMQLENWVDPLPQNRLATDFSLDSSQSELCEFRRDQILNLGQKKETKINEEGNEQEKINGDENEEEGSTSFLSEVESNAMLFIQMQLCNQSLRLWLSHENRSIDKERNRDILCQILEGLHFIHSSGFIHRDLTPNNIFLRRKKDGSIKVKIGDFGLSVTSNAEEESTLDVSLLRISSKSTFPSTLPSLSASHNEYVHTSGVGTTLYAAPEQIEGDLYGSKVDIFSFGLIMLEMYHSFKTEMERVMTISKWRKADVFSGDMHNKFPLEFQVAEKLLNKDPNHRPSAAEILSSSLFLNRRKNAHRAMS